MVEVVVPEGVDAETSLARRPDQTRLLRFVFGHQKGASARGRSADLPGNGRQDMLFRYVVYGLRRVEPQTVEMKFLDPIRRIGQNELSYLRGRVPVEVQSLAPLGGLHDSEK